MRSTVLVFTVNLQRREKKYQQVNVTNFQLDFPRGSKQIQILQWQNLHEEVVVGFTEILIYCSLSIWITVCQVQDDGSNYALRLLQIALFYHLKVVSVAESRYVITRNQFRHEIRQTCFNVQFISLFHSKKDTLDVRYFSTATRKRKFVVET